MTMSVAAQERLDGKAPKELTKEERLAKRKESLNAADTPEDRRGTKEKPEKQTFRENLAAGLSSRRQAEAAAGCAPAASAAESADPATRAADAAAAAAAAADGAKAAEVEEAPPPPQDCEGG